MNARLTLLVGILGAGLFAIPVSADAQFFSNSTGISNPAETITFSEHVLPNNTPVTNQYSDLGVTFDPNNVWYNPAPSDPHTSGIDPPDIGNFFPNHTASDPFFIKFNLDQTAAAFAVGINPGGTGTFMALLDGQQVASGSAPVGPVGTVANDYYGFSGISFDTIEVFFNNTQSQAGVIDNVQLSSVVPEPATVAAAVLAILACGIHLARRQLVRR
jgi:hypothetical protein